MPPIRLNEKWLSGHPQVAEKIKQVEAVQNGPKNDAPGRPESGEKGPGNGIIPPIPGKGLSMRLVAIAAAVLLLVGGTAYAMGHQSNQQQYIQAVKQHVAQVTSQPAKVSTTQNPVQQPASAPKAQTPQAAESQPVQVSINVQSPDQGIPGTVTTVLSLQDPISDQYGSISYRQGLGGVLDSLGGKTGWVTTNSKGQVIYNGTSYKAAAAAWVGLHPGWSAAQSEPSITGQVVNDRLSVILEVNGREIKGALDTGSMTTNFPDSFLRGLGLSPIGTQTVQGITGQQVEYKYQVSSVNIFNGNSWETLSGPRVVWGTQFSGALIGEDILQGDNLQINGNTWTLRFGG